MLQRHLCSTPVNWTYFWPTRKEKGLPYWDSANRRVKYYAKFTISNHMIKLKLLDYKRGEKVGYMFLSKFPLKVSRFSVNQWAVFDISQPAQKCHLTTLSLTVAPSISLIFILKSVSPIGRICSNYLSCFTFIYHDSVFWPQASC